MGTGKIIAAASAARRAKPAAEDMRDAAGKMLSGIPRVVCGALRAPRHARCRDHLPCARGPGSRIAFVNFVLP